ncbi:MAG: type II toxin-antitoxin system HicB family antitoxin [Chloroflexi bacterium]|nr:type II toxin-antitoxin system HicB family antitoxin [Chloroflexota bacterium]
MVRSKSTLEFRVQVFVEPDDKGFHAYCPALKGLHTYGDTRIEAVQNAKDAIEAYLKSSIKHGDPIPLGILHEHTETPDTEGNQGRYSEELSVAFAT